MGNTCCDRGDNAMPSTDDIVKRKRKNYVGDSTGISKLRLELLINGFFRGLQNEYNVLNLPPIIVKETFDLCNGMSFHGSNIKRNVFKMADLYTTAKLKVDINDKLRIYPVNTNSLFFGPLINILFQDSVIDDADSTSTQEDEAEEDKDAEDTKLNVDENAKVEQSVNLPTFDDDENEEETNLNAQNIGGNNDEMIEKKEDKKKKKEEEKRESKQQLQQQQQEEVQQVEQEEVKEEIVNEKVEIKKEMHDINITVNNDDKMGFGTDELEEDDNIDLNKTNIDLSKDDEAKTVNELEKKSMNASMNNNDNPNNDYTPDTLNVVDLSFKMHFYVTIHQIKSKLSVGFLLNKPQCEDVHPGKLLIMPHTEFIGFTFTKNKAVFVYEADRFDPFKEPVKFNIQKGGTIMVQIDLETNIVSVRYIDHNNKDKYEALQIEIGNVKSIQTMISFYDNGDEISMAQDLV